MKASAILLAHFPAHSQCFDQPDEEARMEAKAVGLDVAQLKAEISKTYTAVSREPDREFIFPT